MTRCWWKFSYKRYDNLHIMRGLQWAVTVIDETVRVRNWPVTVNFLHSTAISQFLTASSTTAHCSPRIRSEYSQKSLNNSSRSINTNKLADRIGTQTEYINCYDELYIVSNALRSNAAGVRIFAFSWYVIRDSPM